MLLGKKITHYKALFLHISQDGFIMKPFHVDTHLSLALGNLIGQLGTTSYPLEI